MFVVACLFVVGCCSLCRCLLLVDSWWLSVLDGWLLLVACWLLLVVLLALCVVSCLFQFPFVACWLLAVEFIIIPVWIVRYCLCVVCCVSFVV